MVELKWAHNEQLSAEKLALSDRKNALFISLQSIAFSMNHEKEGGKKRIINGKSKKHARFSSNNAAAATQN